MSRAMAKILFYLIPLFIIALLALILADPYYRFRFYRWYVLISLGVMVVIWVTSSMFLKMTYVYPRPDGFFWRLTAAWTITAILAWVINQLLLSGFLVTQGSRAGWSVFLLLFTWVAGLVSVLAWQFILSFLQRVFLAENLRTLRLIFIVIGGIIVALFAAVAIINLSIRHKFNPVIYTYENVPIGGTAVVFGAGVYQESGQPSLVLRERLETAAELVRNGKVASVLLSGDGSEGSIEVDVMAQYSLELGILEEMLMVDREGYRTVETCRRAYEDFVVRDALLVTQDFHLPRALFLCNSVGLSARGVQADRRVYSPFSRLTWAVRESVATAYAWLEVVTGR
jgi:SanA protein